MSNPIRPPQDMPREELMALASETLKRYRGQGATVYFKFTCEHCGERCTFQQPNALYETGECHKCGASTEITHGGFMLILGDATEETVNEFMGGDHAA